MSMEKNGAISSETPNNQCCGGGCHSKQASQERQLPPFPETEEQADAMEQDLTKSATDAVEKASKSSQ